MITFFKFAAIWYSIGFAVLAMAIYLDWRDGDDLKLGELLGSVFLALMGPFLLIPMFEYFGINAAIKKSWKGRMDSPVLRGKRRDRE